MCLGIPGEVVAITDASEQLATVSVNGVRRKVSLALVGDSDIAVGDWVLIHVGFALSRIDPDEAKATLDQILELDQAYADELDAFRRSAISSESEGGRIPANPRPALDSGSASS